MCPQNWLFSFHSAGMGFSGKKFQSYYSPWKRLYSFLLSDAPFPEEWSCSPKVFFRGNFGKYCLKKSYEKYSNPFFLQKSLCWFLLLDTPSAQIGHVLPQMNFCNFFNINWSTSQGFPARRYTHLKENFMENKFRS